MIEQIFTTPIFQKQMGVSTLSAIQGYLRTGKFGISNKANSTRRGYQSDQTLLESPEPEIQLLKQAIFACVNEYFNDFYKAQTGQECKGHKFQFDLWGWVTQFGEGGYNAPHIHPRSTISGVYYVETPINVLKNEAGDFAGFLCLLDPRSGSQNWPLPGHLTHFFIPPEPGSIILFPSYLPHFVPPFNGEGMRTAIAFNLRHKV